MHTTPVGGDDRGDAALDWLVGRLRWERILRELHDKAEGSAPLTTVAELVEPGDSKDEQAA
jgi:hypothetical protein